MRKPRNDTEENRRRRAFYWKRFGSEIQGRLRVWALKKDLRILGLVISAERRRLEKQARTEKKAIKSRVWAEKVLKNKAEFAEKNRVRALADYHKNRDSINEKRRVPEKRRLIAAIRRFTKRLKVEKPIRLRKLENSARRAFGVPRMGVEQKIRKRLCSRWERAMKAKAVSSVVVQMSGSSLTGVKNHLASLFTPGMAWANHGYGEGKWNIDHIRPLASFTLSDLEQAKQAFHYTNLQPLWHQENMKKRDSY